MNSAAPEPLAYSIADAARVAPFKKTRLYELIAEGKLVSRKVGRRRFITAESLRALIEGQAA
jgi:Helix-turn-helix domain